MTLLKSNVSGRMEITDQIYCVDRFGCVTLGYNVNNTSLIAFSATLRHGSNFVLARLNRTP